MGKKYLKFILPSTLSFLLTGIYSIVDGIFVGRAMGDDGLAAINIAWPLVALIIALGTGIGMGASVMVSLNLGAGNEKAADKMEGNAFFLLFVSSLLLTAFLYLAGSPLLTLLGAEGVIHGHALTYLSYMLLGGGIQVRKHSPDALPRRCFLFHVLYGLRMPDQYSPGLLPGSAGWS